MHHPSETDLALYAGDDLSHRGGVVPVGGKALGSEVQQLAAAIFASGGQPSVHLSAEP